MRKNTTARLPLHRDTLHRLDSPTLLGDALQDVRGGVGKVSSDNQQCTYSRLCQQQTL